MDFIPLLPFLGVSVPESLVLYYMALSIANIKKTPVLVIAIALLTSLFSYFIRSIPIVFGFHSIIQVILMVIFLNLFFRLSWTMSITVMILTSVALGLSESIFVPLLAFIFNFNLEQVISDPLLRILFTLPHLFFLATLAYFINKRQWKLPLIHRLIDANGKGDERAKRNSFRQTYLFILCIVQALMLVLLNISFHIYASGVYPSFTVEFLTIISSVVLFASAVATIFVARFLLKITEQEAKLETELRHVWERHNLSLKLHVERHDFYNHLTAVYGYMKAGHYVQAQSYIENLNQTVRNINSLLKVHPPELAAILSVKLEEAKRDGIEFRWQINIESDALPICPEDLTHAVGNLLENAVEAAKEDHSPKVDFSLICNNFGLELKISNNGKLIPQDIKQSIFDAGYTTKDTKRHSGLGLYIINQIIERYGGSIIMNEPEYYEGVQFVLYMPWKK